MRRSANNRATGMLKYYVYPPATARLHREAFAHDRKLSHYSQHACNTDSRCSHEHRATRRSTGFACGALSVSARPPKFRRGTTGRRNSRRVCACIVRPVRGKLTMLAYEAINNLSRFSGPLVKAAHYSTSEKDWSRHATRQCAPEHGAGITSPLRETERSTGGYSTA